MKAKKVELLSPAGSFDCLQAAISAGADAIYFGVEQLNMRTRSSSSFLNSDIREIATVCKLAGIKSYITLNTVMYEHDMQLLQTILKEVKQQGIDAVIASDFAVIEYCRQLNIPLHISTQANVSNIEAVQFFSKFSDVVVLARELTLKQVENICTTINREKIKGVSGELLKIEIFVHGALCMAISGKCYLSLHAQNASANRGACVQNCRRPYKVTDAETNEELLVDNEYIMSPKDLCAINILDQVINSGVDVLKIEGRSKGADYVYTVTQCYREALQAIENNNYTSDKIIEWQKRLATVYNRGFWEGYYLGRKMGEWTPQSGSVATEKKIYVGKGTKYYPKIQVGEFIIEAGSIKAGDMLMISGPVIGMAKEKMETLIVNGLKAAVAKKGDKITFPFGIKISPQDKLYKIVATVNG
ncbi:peptidase U32 family protein [Ferruginibacter sp.]|nr:U32 family peptidase [Ferruginibacter sp.]